MEYLFKKNLVIKFLGLLLLLCLLTNKSYSQGVKVNQKGNVIEIENTYVQIAFDLSSGLYKGIDKQKNIVAIDSAFASIPFLFATSDPNITHEWSKEAVDDSLGLGKRITIISSKRSTAALPQLIFSITIYQGKKFVVLNTGLKNSTNYAVTVKELHPITAKAFKSKDGFQNFHLLDGNGGGEITEVSEKDELQSRNNLLATFTTEDEIYSLVVGGLTYHDFEKFAKVSHNGNYLNFDLWSKDPVGKKVKSGTTYLPSDKYYLDFATSNPFKSLENYGLAIQSSQQINLNMYTFPTVGLWYSSMPEYGGGPYHNNTSGAVWEMKQVVKSGFLKYSKVAIRLVPDNYEVNNQQGWWDDKHWQMYGDERYDIAPTYRPPYETTEKWGQAIVKRGGIPLIYFQTSRRSEDYAVQHPKQMLFNDSHSRYNTLPQGHTFWWYESNKNYPWHSYDFTDSSFVKHMKEVYSNFKNGGIKGLMFDYARTGWAYEGGFDDENYTTAAAYRRIFELASNGLGKEHYIHERNLTRGSDITLGLVTSQRNWGDTDRINPTMITRNGLRWYKNRVVVNYDMDAKNPFHAKPNNRDGVRAMFTMAYVVSGRLLLGVSFAKMKPEQLEDLSRVYPFHSTPQSARPIDAFSNKKYPQIYDFKVNKEWHQLTFYNTKSDSTGEFLPSKISVDLGKNFPFSGLGLSPDKDYYVYDFWNDKYVGEFIGDANLTQDLRPGEARMMSVHEEKDHPQFISTNRHIMQGYISLKDVEWDTSNNRLNGIVKVIGGETYKIVIATNGYQPMKSKSSSGRISIDNRAHENGLIELSIKSSQNKDIKWSVRFKKN